MNEASKTNAIRKPDFFTKYLRGRVIDIGAGPDLVCEWAERFDIEDGDANVITKYRPAGTYDAVHSSHCLEHMHNPEAALSEWWSLIKPGGYLIVVVPDEDLYEQGIWPSMFNSDHKSSFRLGKPTSWSPVSFDLRQMIAKLPLCEIISAEKQDAGYDHWLRKKFGERIRPIRGLQRLTAIRGRFPRASVFLRPGQTLLIKCGAILDQTLNGALAQIQVVARKKV